MTREELIAALERADGPSRELDAEIAKAAFPNWRVDRDRFWSDGDHDAWCIRRDGRRDTPCNEALPSFTSSLDAALTLVPEGWSPLLGQNVHHKNWMALVQTVTADGGIVGPHANGPTPAIALCSAALKARA